MYRSLLIITLLLFGALTVVALLDHGYWGIIEPHFQTFGAAQVFFDLVIALSFFLIWMWQDAKQLGRNPWPWIVGTLTTGSIAPLLYLITRNDDKKVASTTKS